MKLVDFLDFNGNQARNILIHPSATTPSSLGAGTVFTATAGAAVPTVVSGGTTSGFFGNNGTSWVRLDNIYNTAADIFSATATPTNGISSGTFTAGNIVTTTAGKLTDSGVSYSNLFTLSGTSLSGDVTGLYNATVLSSIKGVALTITSLTGGDSLYYNGTAWVNKKLTYVVSGDITCTPSTVASTGVTTFATTVNAIKGVAVPTLATGNLRYNGSAWIFDSTAYLTASTGVTTLNGTSGAITLAAGTGIGIAGTSTITITNNGVTSAVAGSNITVSGATGAVTIGVSATPTFTSVTTTNLTTTNFTLGSQVLTYNTTLTNNTDIVTKLHLDQMSFGLRDFKESARVATTVNLSVTETTTTLTATANGVLTIDGVTVVAGDRILVKNQTATEQNGIYTMTTTGTASVAFVLTRTSDFNSMGANGEISSGAFIYVNEGTANAKTGWVVSSLDSVLTTLGSATLGTIVWTQFSGAGTYVQGANITITGSTIALATTLTGLTSVTTTSLVTTNLTVGTLTGILKAASGVVSVATAGTDYLAPSAISGTTNTITKFTSATAIGNSLLTDNGTTLTYTGASGLVTPALKIGTISGVLIASSGTVSAVTILTTTNGGTGLASYTAGDMLYYSSGTALSKLAKGTAGQLLGMNIAGTAPEYKTLSSSSSALTINTSVAGAITLGLDKSLLDTSFTTSITFGINVSTQPTATYGTVSLNSSVGAYVSPDGSTVYLLEITHSKGAQPTGCEIVDVSNGEVIFASIYSADYTTLNAWTTGELTTSTSKVCIRISSASIGYFANATPKTIKVTLNFD